MRNFECKYARERCLEMRIHVLFCNVTREKNSWGDLSWTVITFHEIQDDLNCVMHNLAVLGPRKQIIRNHKYTRVPALVVD